jgi:methanethiol S-methyltransferase
VKGIGIVTIALYGIAYAALHSWLASNRVKRWAHRKFGPRIDCWYRLLFNAMSALALIPLGVLLFVLPDQVLYELPRPWRDVATGMQGLLAVCLVYGVWITDGLHFLGIRQLFQSTHHSCSERQPPLAVIGLYRWVRHPLYTLSILLIWLTPTMTLNLAALYVVFTIYFYVGTFFEEQRLVEEFGEAYTLYQAQAPRLVPWRGAVDVRIPTASHDTVRLEDNSAPQS